MTKLPFIKDVTCGAVCVYPARVADAVKTLTSLKLDTKIPVAAVATGFPSGQYHLETRLKEISLTVNEGASEIDIVINRTAVLQGNWRGIKWIRLHKKMPKLF